jgi:hypothetical protein
LPAYRRASERQRSYNEQSAMQKHTSPFAANWKTGQVRQRLKGEELVEFKYSSFASLRIERSSERLAYFSK